MVLISSWLVLCFYPNPPSRGFRLSDTQHRDQMLLLRDGNLALTWVHAGQYGKGWKKANGLAVEGLWKRQQLQCKWRALRWRRNTQIMNGQSGDQIIVL